MRNLNCIALSASNASSSNGASIDANQLIAGSIQAHNNDGTATGSIKLQMSNDINTDQYQPQIFVPTNWTDIPSATATMTAGGTAVVFLPQMAFRWIRAVYTSTVAGSSTVVINLNAVGY